MRDLALDSDDDDEVVRWSVISPLIAIPHPQSPDSRTISRQTPWQAVDPAERTAVVLAACANCSERMHEVARARSTRVAVLAYRCSDTRICTGSAVSAAPWRRSCPALSPARASDLRAKDMNDDNMTVVLVLELSAGPFGQLP